MIQSLLARLHGLSNTATIHLRIADTPSRQSAFDCVIALTPQGAFLEDEPLTEPALSVTLPYATFVLITNGECAFSQAYLEGKILLKGDLELAQCIAEKFHSEPLPVRHQEPVAFTASANR